MSEGIAVSDLPLHVVVVPEQLHTEGHVIAYALGSDVNAVISSSTTSMLIINRGRGRLIQRSI